MSRNLSRTDCQHCGQDAVVINGPVSNYEDMYPEDQSELSKHLKGMQVACAVCEYCECLYMAWVWPSPNMVWERPNFKPDWTLDTEPSKRFYDLSYRSTFNDEPGRYDIPAERPPSPVDLLKRYKELKLLFNQPFH